MSNPRTTDQIIRDFRSAISDISQESDLICSMLRIGQQLRGQCEKLEARNRKLEVIEIAARRAVEAMESVLGNSAHSDVEHQRAAWACNDLQQAIAALDGDVKRSMTAPKPHNPDGLESPGEGYRFLDEDEIQERIWSYPKSIHVWERDESKWDKSGWNGNSRSLTYRTKLSREELAKLI